jgi:hypothetical protein
MNKYWFDYVKSCYDLVVESEGKTSIFLEHDVEAYIVQLMAKNFERTDIGQRAIAIQILEATSTKKQQNLLNVGDECLLIYSYPLKQSKWPSPTYYRDMGIVAYGMANHMMEKYFDISSKILNVVFKQKM